ncbi:DUF4906 domain-containing protein [Parabacteroides sp.]
MILMSLVLMNTGCEEQIAPANIPSKEGKMVEVSLNIGFADEADGATLSATPSTKSSLASGRQAAFDMQLLPAVRTKAASNYPNKLYNLDIYQYKADGSHLKSFTVGASVDPGAAITSTLDYNDGNECQLLIIARGATQAVTSLSGKSLSEVRKMTTNTTTIENISATDGTDINNMPYLLYLPKVKISLDGKLVSPEGTDVRLLLKRLAVGLTIKWTFNVSGYTLTEVRLMQVPKDYRILPEGENLPPYGTMYPTSVSEFVDGFRLKGEELAKVNETNLWMPANARGIRNDVTYPTYRNKNYAHSAATYVEFVVDGKGNGQRLLYRAYLGGNTTSDFNLFENTNYNWTINLKNANYTNDPRIQLLDLTPVVSSNLQTTSNCFMMKPGTNICFNPYKHEAGVDGWNTYLTSNETISKTIDKVEILWQSKDAGTSGDLVMGYVVDDTNHKNLVNLTNESDINNALVHVKVPVTHGGNAVIAAYNGSTIVWSWHLWISNYVPVGLSGTITSVSRDAAIQAAQNATKEGMVHVYGGISWTDPNGAFYNKVIMDRYLGATRAGIQDNLLDAVRTFGLLYQGGRKDPFFSSADGTGNETKTIYNGDGKEMEIKRLNSTSYGDVAIQNPASFITGAQISTGYGWDGDTKTIQDPCPKGWRVPSNKVKQVGTNQNDRYTITNASQQKESLWAGFGSQYPYFVAQRWIPGINYTTEGGTNNNFRYYNGSKLQDFTDTQASDIVGSGFIYTGGSGDKLDLNSLTDKSAFYPAVSLRENGTGNYRAGGSLNVNNNTIYMWSSTLEGASMHIYSVEEKMLKVCHYIGVGHGFSVRCIQE